MTAALLLLVPLAAGDLCVTHGAVGARPGGGLVIDDPEVRAVAARPGPAVARLRFTYLGPTARTAPLSSGELRRQIGLKLRAQDSCNLVYVMWRIAPVPALVVSVKRNPGQRTGAECGARGYRTVATVRDLPPIAVGAPRELAADMSGDELRVSADGHEVWRGRLGADVLDLDGPVGLRSDNGRFAVELEAASATAPSPGSPRSGSHSCRPGSPRGRPR